MSYPRAPRVEIVCAECPRNFSVRIGDHRIKLGRAPKYCSRACMGLATRTRSRCLRCDAPYSGRVVKKFCSSECRYASTRKGVAGTVAWESVEYRREYHRRYRSINRAKVNAVQAAYKRANRELFNRQQRARRAAGRSLGYERKLRLVVLATMAGCLRCGSTERLEMDHVKPVSLGGRTGPENVQALCVACNKWKSDTEVDYRTEEIKAKLLKACYGIDVTLVKKAG